MPAISADTLALPRIPDPELTAVDRPVRSVTTAPSGLEGEGFPVRRAFACSMHLPASGSNRDGGFITDGDTQWMTAGAVMSISCR
jgi:hypothetical protein